MTDEELIARLRDCANGIGSFKSHQGDWGLCDDAADRIKQVTKQLAAARRDAEIAEEELELQEEEACMMENSYLELRKERDALEYKLAKAVRALEFIGCDDGPEGKHARATLAEIKGT